MKSTVIECFFAGVDKSLAPFRQRFLRDEKETRLGEISPSSERMTGIERRTFVYITCSLMGNVWLLCIQITDTSVSIQDDSGVGLYS